jgi:2,3-bisphosphoglycerate-independent phosphoglycerate mutase
MLNARRWKESSVPIEDFKLDRDLAVAEPAGPVTLVIMDGVGIGRRDQYDAVFEARTPNLDALSAGGLYREIFAHGKYVGLASNSDMGNSEVGHNTMGAGRIVDQGAKRIENALESGSIWTAAWPEIIANVRSNSSTLHLIGLLSDGNIHSNISHLFAILERAATEGVARARIHGLLDGRDVPDRSADEYVVKVERFLSELNAQTGVDFRIASGGGRMVTTMDRYRANWAVVEAGWKAHTLGTARPFSSTLEAIETARTETPGISDQLIPAYTIVGGDGEPLGRIQNGDSVLVFNFRGDRVIEISEAFVFGDEFLGFDRGPDRPVVTFAGMTLYDGDTNFPPRRLVEPDAMSGTVSEYIAGTGLRQWAGAETQKFGHVTYFWNGNRSEAFDPESETYLEVPSDRVPFDQRPWMKSAETADAVIDAVTDGNYDFLRVNFAGGDMVGHTGSFEASVIAVESVDLAIGRISLAVQSRKGVLVVTADHGNAEDMAERSKSGEVLRDDAGLVRWKTAHSTNKIPLIVVDFGGRAWELNEDVQPGGLSNLAATIVNLLGYRVPDDYDGSLVKPAS